LDKATPRDTTPWCLGGLPAWHRSLPGAETVCPGSTATWRRHACPGDRPVSIRQGSAGSAAGGALPVSEYCLGRLV